MNATMTKATEFTILLRSSSRCSRHDISPPRVIDSDGPVSFINGWIKANSAWLRGRQVLCLQRFPAMPAVHPRSLRFERSTDRLLVSAAAAVSGLQAARSNFRERSVPACRLRMRIAAVVLLARGLLHAP